MQTQILRRCCDNPKCDKEIDLPVGNLTPMLELELSNWIVVSKEHVLNTGDYPRRASGFAAA
jgi:hypothetical protein